MLWYYLCRLSRLAHLTASPLTPRDPSEPEPQTPRWSFALPHDTVLVCGECGPLPSARNRTATKGSDRLGTAERREAREAARSRPGPRHCVAQRAQAHRVWDVLAAGQACVKPRCVTSRSSRTHSAVTHTSHSRLTTIDSGNVQNERARKAESGEERPERGEPSAGRCARARPAASAQHAAGSERGCKLK